MTVSNQNKSAKRAWKVGNEEKDRVNLFFIFFKGTNLVAYKPEKFTTSTTPCRFYVLFEIMSDV